MIVGRRQREERESSFTLGKIDYLPAEELGLEQKYFTSADASFLYAMRREARAVLKAFFMKSCGIPLACKTKP